MIKNQNDMSQFYSRNNKPIATKIPELTEIVNKIMYYRRNK